MTGPTEGEEAVEERKGKERKGKKKRERTKEGREREEKIRAPRWCAPRALMHSLLSLDRDWGTFWFSGTGHETARYPARKQPSIVTKPDPFFRLDQR